MLNAIDTDPATPRKHVKLFHTSKKSAMTWHQKKMRGRKAARLVAGLRTTMAWSKNGQVKRGGKSHKAGGRVPGLTTAQCEEARGQNRGQEAGMIAQARERRVDVTDGSYYVWFRKGLASPSGAAHEGSWSRHILSYAAHRPTAQDVRSALGQVRRVGGLQAGGPA